MKNHCGRAFTSRIQRLSSGVGGASLPALRRRRLSRSAWASRWRRASFADGFEAGLGSGSLTSQEVRAGPRPVNRLFRFTKAATLAIAPDFLARRRSSVVERIIGNAEVGSSILPDGTRFSTRAAPGLQIVTEHPDQSL
jgi:hypothetical protein